MKITSLEIENFKSHKKLELNFNKKNCLIYGENGTGKSSIYYALYAIFKIYFRNQNFDFTKFKNKESENELKVELKIDETKTLLIPSSNYNLPDDININSSKTIYFLNQDTLNSITNGDSLDFYQMVIDNFSKYFSKLHNIDTQYNTINENLNIDNHVEKTKEKIEIDWDFEKLLTVIKLRVNNILQNELSENLFIDFEFEESKINALGTNYKLEKPKILIKLNEEASLKLIYNEAKLKLLSFSIFFALIEIEEAKINNQLKLLVLDDFLTSLDMANRHYLINYIFKKFKKFQIIIFTHNLQFNNLIIEYLNMNKINDWDFKNIYSRLKDNDTESITYSTNGYDYIKQAKEKLDSNELQSCGNLLRKEFERLIHEIEKMNSLGRKEETAKIVELILNKKPVYVNQNNLLNDLIPKINVCKDMSKCMDNNKDKIKDKLQEIIFEDTYVNNHLNAILTKLIFYRKIVLNRSSHDNPNSEIYQKEYKSSLAIIEKLNELVNELNSIN